MSLTSEIEASVPPWASVQPFPALPLEPRTFSRPLHGTLLALCEGVTTVGASLKSMTLAFYLGIQL
jgi:hypothetical protein